MTPPVRPERRRSLYDEYLAEQRGERPTTPTTAPAAPAPRSLYDAYLAEQQAAPARPSLLARARAALGAMAEHPLETAKSLVVAPLEQAFAALAVPETDERVSDAGQAYYAQMGRNVPAGTRYGDLPRVGTQTPAHRALASAQTVGNVLAGPAARALGAIPAAAALGALQSPDDPALGALLGAGFGTAAKGVGTAATRAGSALVRAADVSPGMVEAGTRSLAALTPARAAEPTGAVVVPALTGPVAGPGAPSPKARARARKFLREDIQNAGTTPEAVLDRYRRGELPADAPLAEAVPETIGNTLRDSRVLGGKAAADIERGMKAIREGQHERVRGAIRDAFGGEAPNVADFAQQLAEERAAQGSPLFERANAETGLIDQPRFYQLVDTPWGKRMWNEALMMLAQDEHPLPPQTRAAERQAGTTPAPRGHRHGAAPESAPSGGLVDASGRPLMVEGEAPTGKLIPDLRAMHYFRMAIDNALEHPNEFRVKLPNGEQSGTATTVQAQLRKMRGEVTGMLHGASDTFRQADASWARNSDRMRAFASGREFLTADRDALESVARDLPDHARGVWRKGATAALEKVVDQINDRHDALSRVWESDALRAKMRAALTPAEYAAMEQRMTRELGRRNLVGRVMTGPNTADKQVGVRRLTGELPAEAVGAALSTARGNPAPLANVAARALMKMRALRIGQSTASEIAAQALSEDPQAVLQALVEWSQQEAARRAAPGAVRRAAGVGSSGAAVAGLLGGQGGRPR